MSYCKDLNKGDLIFVSYNNLLLPAIFLDIGLRKNPRFYIISDSRLRNFKERGHLYRDYITRQSWEKSIVKVRPEDVNDSIRGIYDEFINLLQEKGKL